MGADAVQKVVDQTTQQQTAEGKSLFLDFSRAAAKCGSNRITPSLPTTQGLIAGQARCLRHEVIPFRDARRPRSCKSVVFDGSFMISRLFQ